MKRNYHVIDHQDKKAASQLGRFGRANGQLLLPLVELIEQARLAVDSVIEQVDRKTIETMLALSAEQVAGPRTPGKASGAICWPGRQRGRVFLRGRQVEVHKPHLRRKGAGTGGEVAVQAYEALRDDAMAGAQMFETLLRGISTRQYRTVIPAMASTVGVSKAAISREAVEAGTQKLEQLLERRWDAAELLVIYIDGIQFGDWHVLSVVGVDEQGRKHVLGIQLGATENAAAAIDLLMHLRE